MDAVPIMEGACSTGAAISSPGLRSHTAIKHFIKQRVQITATARTREFFLS